jgi:hypothetical protein
MVEHTKVDGSIYLAFAIGPYPWRALLQLAKRRDGAGWRPVAVLLDIFATRLVAHGSLSEGANRDGENRTVFLTAVKTRAWGCAAPHSARRLQM